MRVFAASSRFLLGSLATSARPPSRAAADLPATAPALLLDVLRARLCPRPLGYRAYANFPSKHRAPACTNTYLQIKETLESLGFAQCSHRASAAQRRPVQMVRGAHPFDNQYRKSVPSPSVWHRLEETTLGDLVHDQCRKYANWDPLPPLEGLSLLYAEWACRTGPAERLERLSPLAERIERERGCSWTALIPFLLLDPDPVVIATASLEIALLMPADDDEPFKGAQWIFDQTLEVDSTELGDREIAMAQGLFMTGHPEILKFVRTIWDDLDATGRAQFADLRAQVAWMSGVQFLIDRMNEPVDPWTYGAIAGALAKIPGTVSVILDGDRPIPSWSGSSRDEGVRRWPILEAARVLAPQLRSLAAIETSPRVMPAVLQAWGISHSHPNRFNGGSSMPRNRTGQAAKSGQVPSSGPRILSAEEVKAMGIPLSETPSLMIHAGRSASPGPRRDRPAARSAAEQPSPSAGHLDAKGYAGHLARRSAALSVGMLRSLIKHAPQFQFMFPEPQPWVRAVAPAIGLCCMEVELTAEQIRTGGNTSLIDEICSNMSAIVPGSGKAFRDYYRAQVQLPDRHTVEETATAIAPLAARELLSGSESMPVIEEVLTIALTHNLSMTPEVLAEAAH